MNNTDKSILDTDLFVKFPQSQDERGNLTIISKHDNFNWETKNIYIIHDIPEKGTRGNHAHKTLRQIIFAISGSFNVSLFDGQKRKTYILDTPSKGLIIPKMVWIKMYDFVKNTVILVLTDGDYDESEYIRNISDYQDSIT